MKKELEDCFPENKQKKLKILNMVIMEDESNKKNDWQRTTIPSGKLVERKWFCLDLKNKIAGRAAVKIAKLLRGKNETDFTLNLDRGHFVVLLNAKLVKFSGKRKLEQKKYYDHSGYAGGLRERTTKVMLERYPQELLRRIVKGMMPRNKLSQKQLKRLFVFPTNEHHLKAQSKEFIPVSLV